MSNQIFLKINYQNVMSLCFRHGSLLDKTSARKSTKALWLSLVSTVLYVALMSFLIGQFPQMSLATTPTQDRFPWMSLECIL